jgi:hypothetical protein
MANAGDIDENVHNTNFANCAITIGFVADAPPVTKATLDLRLNTICLPRFCWRIADRRVLGKFRTTERNRTLHFIALFCKIGQNHSY